MRPREFAARSVVVLGRQATAETKRYQLWLVSLLPENECVATGFDSERWYVNTAFVSLPHARNDDASPVPAAKPTKLRSFT